MKQFAVYLTIYSGNKMPPFYIGYSYNIHERNYYGTPSSKLYKDIFKKELSENPHKFKVVILKEFGDDIKAAKKYETYIQKALNVAKNPLYINRCIQHVDYYSIPHTNESKAKLSKHYKGKNYKEIYGADRALIEAEKRGNSNRGKKRTEKTKELISKGKIGKKHTEEAKQKISNGNIYKGKDGFFKGKNHTEEAKQKISARQKGRIKSDIERKKISDALTGNKLSDETKNKISKNNGRPALNKVSCVDKDGNKLLIDSTIFWADKHKPIEERAYVGITSKEGRRRINLKCDK